MGHKAYGTIEGLTELQKRFTERIVSGESPTLAAAYREVYGSKGETPAARKGQSNNASKLWRHTGVQLLAEKLRRDLQAKRNRRLAGLQDRIRERLWKEATPKGVPVHSDTATVLGIGEKGSDRIAALRLLAQSVGMFSDHDEDEPQLSRAELMAEIVALISEHKVPDPENDEFANTLEPLTTHSLAGSTEQVVVELSSGPSLNDV